MPTIKKYENRRLYDTDGSRYVNLEDIAAMVQRGEPVTVSDVKTGRDLTRETLLQVLLAQEGGAELLPIGMLRRVIRATGDDPVQRMLRPHVATALELVHTQLDDLEGRLLKSFPNLGRGPTPTPTANPFAGGAGANPFAGAAGANPFAGVNPFAGMNPFAAGNPFASAPARPVPPFGEEPPPDEPIDPPAPEPAPAPHGDGDGDDLDALRKRLDELEARLRKK